MKAAVIGLGQFGTAAARALARAGVDTLAIDSDPAPVDRLKDEVDLAVCTDGTVQANLEDQGVGDVDLLVAGIGADFEAQILVIVAAKQLGIARIIARAASEVHGRVLLAVGADEIVYPEKEAAHGAILRTLVPARGTPVNLGDGLTVVEITAPEGLVGRVFRDIAGDVAERHAVALVAIRRPPEPDENGKRHGEVETILSPDERVREGDSLVLAGDGSGIAKAAGRTGFGRS